MPPNPSARAATPNRIPPNRPSRQREQPNPQSAKDENGNPMVSVPGFLLRRLYRKGSLRNADGGCEFTLENRLGSGYAQRMLPLAIDGADMNPDKVAFILDGKTTPFSAVSPDAAFTLAMNKTITVRINGASLSPGPHTVAMGFVVPGIGALRFDFTDVVE